jgi:hypothetical protein
VWVGRRPTGRVVTRGPIARTPLLVLGLAALFVTLLAGVPPDGEYVAEPGELVWKEPADGEVLPVLPYALFTLVVTFLHLGCFDEVTGEPIAEDERIVADDALQLFADSKAITSYSDPIPCAVAPASEETAAPFFLGFPQGLAEWSTSSNCSNRTIRTPPLSVVRTWQVVAPTDGVPIAVDAENHYVLEPGEINWDSFEDGGVLPVPPDEAFTIVVDDHWISCFDWHDGVLEPVSEEVRAETWSSSGRPQLTVDGVPVVREELLIPCTGSLVADPETGSASVTTPELPWEYAQGVVRWRFPDGLPEGSYVFEIWNEGADGTREDVLRRCTVRVVSGADETVNGEEPVVVPRPERVETGGGGAAETHPPVPALLVAVGVLAITTSELVVRRR